MKLSTLFLRVLALTVILSGLAEAQQKNLIMFIGDGYGIAPKTAARMALGQGKDGSRFSTDPNFHLLQIDALKYVNPVTTHSLNSWITDSAPGSSVYAVGKNGKQDNEMLSINSETGVPIQTILEAAKKQGYAIGLVTTTRITHATPAAWATHIWNRDLEDYIAAQYISSSQAEYEAIFNTAPNTYDATRDWVLPAPKVGVEVDVLMGGGSRHFLPKAAPGANNYIFDSHGDSVRFPNGKAATLGSASRTDNADLIAIAKTRGFTYVNSRDALMNVDLSQFTPTNNKKLLGLFRNTHMTYEQDRQLWFQNEPSLADMTKMAIEILKRKSTKGFLLLVEGGRIDHLEHGNCGGLAYVPADPDTSKHIPETYKVASDVEAAAEDLSYNGAAGAKTAVQLWGASGVTGKYYGSDYMIKEVMAYDYAIGEGRKLLADNSAGQTLLMASSDHECGGFAVVGLHDELDAQKNGTKVRTYAKTPTKTPNTPSPTGVVRGDNNINGWYPEYSMVTFQGYQYPQAPETGRRIVVSYGSNPQTNGNGLKVGGTPGNHTPQDVLAYADDNVGGTYASRITGKGLLDNTDLCPIMESFLGVSVTTKVNDKDPSVTAPGKGQGILYPNPAMGNSLVNVTFNVEKSGPVTVEFYNAIGQRIRRIDSGSLEKGSHTITWDSKDDAGLTIAAGMYVVNVKSGSENLSDKLIIE